MIKNLIILGIIGYAFLVSSCKTEVALPAQGDGKLAVFSFITPGADVKVALGLSRAYFGTVPLMDYTVGNIKNATITISDGTTTANIPWDATQSQYTLSAAAFPIVVGKQYFLEISVPDVGKLSAQTTIPQPILNPSFRLNQLIKGSSTIHSSISYTKEYDQFLYNFSVPGGIPEGSYYRFYSRVQQLGAATTTHTYRSTYYHSIDDNPAFGDPYFAEYSSMSSGPLDAVVVLRKNYHYEAFYKLNSTTVFEHTGYFISGSREYYLFYKSLKANLGKDPDFFAEPGDIYSNISGGYGVFAGYHMTVLPSFTTSYGP